MFKILASEVQGNTTASYFSNQRVIRLANKGTAARTITLGENARSVALTINASANGTTLLTLTPGGDTANLHAGLVLVYSTNLAVINTGVASVIATVVNTTAITSNVDIIIANGTCTVYAVDNIKTFTMIPNSEFIIEKGRTDILASSSDTDIVAMPVTYRG